MLALMVVAALVFVLQLGVVGSWARSVRLTTLVQTLGIGFVVCGPATIGVEWALTRVVARVGSSPSWADAVARAAWTYDPVVEELVKVSPLVVLAVVWRRAHRQLGWTDHLLVGAALGMGFSLCESALGLARVGPGVQRTGWLESSVLGDGYVVSQSMSGMSVVPSIGTSLTSWLPGPTRSYSWMSERVVPAAGQHVAWTVLAVLGVAWAFRRRGVWRVLGVVPVGVACLAHAAHNADSPLTSAPFARTWVARASVWVGDQVAARLVLLLVLLVVADRVGLAWSRRSRPDLLLAGEPWHGLLPVRVAATGLVAPPWSTLVVWNVVLQRRAGLYALGAGDPAAEAAAVARSVGQLGQATDRARWSAAARTVRRSISWRGLRSWRMVVWLVAILPAVAYLVVGGFPSTRGLQETMSGPVGTSLLVAGLLAGLVVALSQVPLLIKALRGLRDHPAWHEAWIRPTARLAMVTTTTASTAVLLVALAAAGGDATVHVVRNHHILEAFLLLMAIVGIALTLAAFSFFPPAALITAATISGETSTVLVGTITGEFLGLAVSGEMLAGGGNVLLNQAADRSSSSSSSSGGSSSDSAAAGQDSGPVFKTDAEAGQAAREMGYTKTNYRSNGQAVFKKGNRYITRDVDGHNGGAWKVALKKPENLGSKSTREGTWNKDLTIKVGG